MTDDSSDWLRAATRRMRPAHDAQAWLALIVRAFVPDEGSGHPPHYLVGAWAPGATGLRERLPEFAAIASPDGTRALRELFVHLPPDVPVHLTDDAHADASLLARMVLLCDRHLEAYQREGLERFVHACDRRLAEAIAARYTDEEPGFARFRARVAGGLSSADSGDAGATPFGNGGTPSGDDAGRPGA